MLGTPKKRKGKIPKLTGLQCAIDQKVIGGRRRETTAKAKTMLRFRENHEKGWMIEVVGIRHKDARLAGKTWYVTQIKKDKSFLATIDDRLAKVYKRKSLAESLVEQINSNGGQAKARLIEL